MKRSATLLNWCPRPRRALHFSTGVYNRRYVESWLAWIVVDQVSVVLFWSREMHLTAVLYAIFLTMCVAGLVEWRRSVREGTR